MCHLCSVVGHFYQKCSCGAQNFWLPLNFLRALKRQFLVGAYFLTYTFIVKNCIYDLNATYENMTKLIIIFISVNKKTFFLYFLYFLGSAVILMGKLEFIFNDI